MFYPRYFVSKTDIEEGHQPEIPVKGVNYREEMKIAIFSRNDCISNPTNRKNTPIAFHIVPQE
jgi:hypothetical protein